MLRIIILSEPCTIGYGASRRTHQFRYYRKTGAIGGPHTANAFGKESILHWIYRRWYKRSELFFFVSMYWVGCPSGSPERRDAVVLPRRFFLCLGFWLFWNQFIRPELRVGNLSRSFLHSLGLDESKIRLVQGDSKGVITLLDYVPNLQIGRVEFLSRSHKLPPLGTPLVPLDKALR